MHAERAPMTKKLSKGVLELKFMKKSKEKFQVQEENEERENLYQDQLSSLHEGADRILMVNSYYDCMDFLPCRLSFGGMDQDIEKLNEGRLTGIYKVKEALPPQKVGEMDTDVTAEEMAQVYRPTNKHRKRKSDQLDDIATEKDDYDDTHDGVIERTHGKQNSERKRSSEHDQAKPAGIKNLTRPIFRDKSKDSGNFSGGHHRVGSFQGNNHGGDNFRGRGRRGGNFRGRSGRGGNFRGRGKSRGNFRGRGKRGGNFRSPEQGGFYDDDRDIKMSENNGAHINKKIKFMKPQE